MLAQLPNFLNILMGVTLKPDGATFRTWAPRAKTLYVSGEFTGGDRTKLAASTTCADALGDGKPRPQEMPSLCKKTVSSVRYSIGILSDWR
jgi:hypothetical protein